MSESSIQQLVDRFDLQTSMKELFLIYQSAKRMVKFYEAKGIGGKVPVNAVNELRNCLDHVMRASAIQDKGRQFHEMNEAKEHAYRAFYDTAELMCMDCAEKIAEVISGYEIDLISHAFPTYYTDISPKLIKAQDAVIKELADKNLDPTTNNKLLDEVETLAKEHYKMFVEVNAKLPHLEAEKKKRKKFLTKQIIWTWITGLATGLISSYIIWWLTKD